MFFSFFFAMQTLRMEMARNFMRVCVATVRYLEFLLNVCSSVVLDLFAFHPSIAFFFFFALLLSLSMLLLSFVYCNPHLWQVSPSFLSGVTSQALIGHSNLYILAFTLCCCLFHMGSTTYHAHPFAHKLWIKLTCFV